MADFDRYAPTLKKWEGGFVNNPADPGGATNKGVTLATFRSFFGKSKTVADLKAMTEQQWRTVMKSYWDRCKGDQIHNQSIAEMLVDWHINAGVNAIKAWQRSAMLDADGIIGPKSLSVLNASGGAATFSRMRDARCRYYHNLVLNNSRYSIFLRGWLNRTNSFKYSEV